MNTAQPPSKGGFDSPAVDPPDLPRRDRLGRLTTTVVICVVVAVVLLPVERFDLPLNVALLDFWNLITLPLFCLYLIRARRTVYLPYAGAMWLILVGSAIGTLSALDQVASVTTVLKEVYLYVWFVALGATLASASAAERRVILLAWVSVVFLHGVLIVAQFLSPHFLQITTAGVGDFGAEGAERPPGLFRNANAGAFYQLMGFVPLLLVGLPRNVTVILGMFWLLSIVGTGSLGATGGFVIGLVIALIATSVVRRKVGSALKVVAGFAAGIALLGGLSYVTLSESSSYQFYRARLEYTFFGRAHHSAEARFAVWATAVNIVLSETPVWGRGPGSFRDERSAKTMHNDLLAFAVERGVMGVLGLLVFGAAATRKATQILLTQRKSADPTGWGAGVFLGASVAALLESLTHQVFHIRSLWFVLAVQEAFLLRMTPFEGAMARAGSLAGQGQALVSPEDVKGG